MWKVSNQEIQNLCATADNLESFQTSIASPETHKRCISVMMRNIGLSTNSKYSPYSANFDRCIQKFLTPPSQRFQGLADIALDGLQFEKKPNRSKVSTNDSTTWSSKPSKNTTTKMGHQHTMFDLHAQGHEEATNVNANRSRSGLFQAPETSVRDDCATSSDVHAEGNDALLERRSSSPVVEQLPSSEASMKSQASQSSTNSFLNIQADHNDRDMQTKIDRTKSTQEPLLSRRNFQSKDGSFDDLVNRLLAQAMSKSDSKFIATFLCLYRKFAAPSVLLSAIIHRFLRLNKKQYAQITRTTSQLRYLSILVQWISNYPGDFAHPLTRNKITNFVSKISDNRYFAVAVKEIRPILNSVTEDDDTDWECSDFIEAQRNSTQMSLEVSASRDLPTPDGSSSGEDLVSNSKDYAESTSQSSAKSPTSSILSNTSGSANQSTRSFQMLSNTIETIQRQSHISEANTKNSLTKDQWHQFMDTDEEDIARELTRIDWIMFSSIQPRDLVRHVSLSDEQKAKYRSLKNVDRMIKHFNHIAFWVANMILLRDKPKHRARALEKCMGIAWVRCARQGYETFLIITSGYRSFAI